MASRTEKLEFQNAEGLTLAGRLELPVETPRGWALFAHCFTCTKDIPAATRICRGLSRRGYAVLRFDFTGLGHSEGDFANSNFSSNVEDLVAAARELGERHEAPRLLVGHSLGGAAVLVAASRIPSVRAVATIAAPSDPAHVTKHFGAVLDQIETDGCAMLTLGGRQFTICKQFLEDLEERNLVPELQGLKAASMILHSPQDPIVGIDHATRLFTALPHPKSFVSLDDADHLLSRAEDADWVAGILSSWAARYLDGAA